MDSLSTLDSNIIHPNRRDILLSTQLNIRSQAIRNDPSLLLRLSILRPVPIRLRAIWRRGTIVRLCASSTWGAGVKAIINTATTLLRQTAAPLNAVSPTIASLLPSEAWAAATNASTTKEGAVPIHANEHSS